MLTISKGSSCETKNLYLDPRDQNWFIERVNADSQREQAGEQLAEIIADPFLAGEGVIRSRARALTTVEHVRGCSSSHYSGGRYTR